MRSLTLHEQERQNDSENEVNSAPPTDSRRHQPTADMICEARCPLCRTPLFVRMDCLGPYFACLCQPRRR
jgi:hypothetical protein